MAILRRTALSAVMTTALLSALALTASAASAEMVLNRNIGTTISSLDPQVNFLVYEGWIEEDLYEGLTAYDAAGNIIPGAAKSWDLSPDGLTYTFHLRDGLKWSNGDPLVAQDFVNSVIRILDPATASQKNYVFSSTISITGAADFMGGKNKDPKSVAVSAPDEKTVVVKLDKPAPYALNYFYSFYCPPLHKPSLDKFGKDWVKPGNIVTNGAYTLTENNAQSQAVLVKNPNFHDAANVKIDKVVYKVTEDENTALKLYKSGAIDMTYDVPTDQLDALKKSNPEELHVGPGLSTYYLDFNLKKAPFDNIKLRQALAYAIDRDALIKVIKGGDVASCSFTIPIPHYPSPKPAECSMSKADRIAAAKKLYAEAGFGPNKKLTVTITAQSKAAEKKRAEVIAVMWKQVLGVDAKVNAVDREAWNNTFTAGTWEAYADDLVGDFVGPEPYLAYMDPRAEAGYNWQSKEYEDLWDKAMLITDTEARYKVLAQAEQLILDSYYLTPNLTEPNRHLVRKTVKGWADSPGDVVPSRFLTVETQ
ncbi:MAG TPA: peptide ABC transporter substrate-binding protein [Terriglobia bacterium]|nr:peptide ABC transporter substrate-binding protein [Terriglobia bacterium]